MVLKRCLKCQYLRKPSDEAPLWACPNCGVVYVKAEAAAREAGLSIPEPEEYNPDNNTSTHGMGLALEEKFTLEELRKREEEQKIRETTKQVEAFKFSYVEENPKLNQEIASSKSNANAVYILYALGFLLGFITTLIGVIVAHVSVNALSEQNWVKSHLRFQIRTFWFSLLWSCIAIGFFWAGLFYTFSTTKNRGYEVVASLIFNPFMLIGYVLIAGAFLWSIYRIIKGWLAYSKEEFV